jgi:basic membrane protein A
MPGSRNDNSFAQDSYTGLLKAEQKYGLKSTRFIDGIESPDDMFSAVTALAQRYPLVLASPTELNASVAAAARQFPEVTFVLLGGPMEKLPNTYYVDPDWYGPGYMAGAIAATLSETGTIGYIGGRLFKPVVDSQKGYSDGAKSVNPGIKVVQAITSMFDSVVTQSAAAAQIDVGADVIWGVVDASFLGIAMAIQRSGKDVDLMGAITSKCSLPIARDYNVVDVTLDYGVIIANVVRDWQEGKLGTWSYKITDPDSLFNLRLCPGKDTPEIKSAIDKAMESLRSADGEAA